MKAADDNTRLIAANRKAFHDFFVEDKLEAGIALVGTEVKSAREGRVNLRDSYAEVREGEVYLVGAHISPYEQGNLANHEPLRPRKLLLHVREIARLQQKINERGYTLVPTRMYFRGSRVKVEIALAHGKKQFDKRADLATRDAQRDVERALRHRDDDR
jgi:SsrA-binding protein